MFFTLITEKENKPDIDRLIEQYSKSLTRLCYILLKDVHLAEEVTNSYKKAIKIYKTS